MIELKMYLPFLLHNTSTFLSLLPFHGLSHCSYRFKYYCRRIVTPSPLDISLHLVEAVTVEEVGTNH